MPRITIQNIDIAFGWNIKNDREITDILNKITTFLDPTLQSFQLTMCFQV